MAAPEHPLQLSLAKSANALALYAGDEALHVQRHYDVDLPFVTVDRTQWGTVITNLVKNAVEAMDGKGTLAVTLHVVGEGTDAQLELVVEDSGPGISPDIQERLFTPYVTTKGSRGTGLGLALVHRIVAEHGGTIEGGKASLGGAAFTVRVPLDATACPDCRILGIRLDLRGRLSAADGRRMLTGNLLDTLVLREWLVASTASVARE